MLTKSIDMELSFKVTRDARAAGLTTDEKAIADLTMMGWDLKDAYLVVSKPSPTMPDSFALTQIEALKVRHEFIDYIGDQETKRLKDAKRLGGGVQIEDEVEVPLKDKEDVLKELLRLAARAKGKEKSDILCKYADLMQMKKDEVKEEDKTVHTYLPLKCYDCSLYIANKKKNV